MRSLSFKARPIRRRAIATSFLACVSFAASSRADDQACFDAALAGQKARKAGEIRAARAAFKTCAQATCPAEVVEHCNSWLKEADHAQPSVVIAAEDEAGHDLTHAAVSVDNEPISGLDRGAAVPVDPGQHMFRMRVAGHPPVDVSLLVREGEKDRRVELRLPAPPESKKPTRTPTSTAAASGPPTLAWILGGTGLVATGVFAYFGAKAVSDRHSLGCDSGCSHDDYTSVHTKFLIADIALGVAVVSLGASTYLFLSSSGGGASQTPAGDARLVGIRGRF